MFKLFQQELRFRLPAILGWGLGLCFFPVVYVSVYPSFADQLADFQQILDLPLYRALGVQMRNFEEYVASTVANLVPVILAIYAVISGTGTLAGEEEDGRLEMIAALPRPRWQIVVAKAVAIVVALAAILAIVATASALTLALIQDQVKTPLTLAAMFRAVMSALPIVAAFAMVSLFLAAFCPSRRIAAALATAAVLVSFLGNNLASMVNALERFRPFFLFHYYDATADAVVNGQEPGNVLVLTAVSVVALGLAVLFFSRRNLTVGAWPWQRGRAPAHG